MQVQHPTFVTLNYHLLVVFVLFVIRQYQTFCNIFRLFVVIIIMYVP